MRQFSHGAILSFLIPVFLLAGQLFLFYPLELYLQNLEEVGVSLGSFFLGLLPAFLLAFIFLCLPCLLPKPGFRQFYRYFLSVSAVLVWINATFLFGDYGPLDGRGLVIEPYTWLSFLQVAVWIFVIGTVFISKKARDMLGGVLLVILCILLLGLVVNMVRFAQAGGFEKKVIASRSFHQSLLEFSPQKNIIHIILDEFQADIMDEILDQDASWEQELDGFYLFENTAAVYPTTVMAVPNMLSGKVYKNEVDKDLYIDDVFANNGFFESLDEGGYRLDFHTIHVYCSEKRLQNCTPHFGGNASILNYEFIDIALFKSVPDIVKPYVFNDERWLLRAIFSQKKYLAHHSGIGYLLWQKFIGEITIDSAEPTYKFFHSGITHSPMVLDENCEMQMASGEITLDNIKQQSICALRQISEFLQRLRALNLYENTFIVISSDHGSNYVAQDFDERFEGRDIEPIHYARSRALLMIKPIASTGDLIRTSRPVSLQDIPQTILASNNLSVIEDGVDVFSISEEQARTREYMYYDWVPGGWAMATLPTLKVYKINGPIDDPNSWPKATDPKIPRQLQCGEIVKFGLESSADVVSTTGLSIVEPWGRWSIRPKAEVKFSRGDTPCESQVLSFVARAFIGKANSRVVASVLLNDELIGTISFREASDQLFTFRVPRLLKANAVNVLRFEIEGSVSPRELGISNDARPLGIGLVELSIE